MGAAITVAIFAAWIYPAFVLIYLEAQENASASLKERIVQTDERTTLPAGRMTHYLFTTILRASRWEQCPLAAHWQRNSFNLTSQPRRYSPVSPWQRATTTPPWVSARSISSRCSLSSLTAFSSTVSVGIKFLLQLLNATGTVGTVTFAVPSLRFPPFHSCVLWGSPQHPFPAETTKILSEVVESL